MKLGTLFAALLMTCTAALAHHSTANFDRSKQQTVTGTVTYFGFTNPHSFFDMDVKAEDGSVGKYKVFAAGRVLLQRYDWNPGDMKAGDVITVTGYPDRKDAHFMYLSRVVFASGKVWERSNIPD
jgi:hypothetical protein